ncbi:MAG: endonuclease G [Chlamydiales bacterium]|jgi:endonuclease G
MSFVCASALKRVVNSRAFARAPSLMNTSNYLSRRVQLRSPSSSAYFATYPGMPLDAKASSIMKFGCPQYNPIRSFDRFVVSYDSRNKIPYWVYECIGKENLCGDADRSKSEFKEDKKFPEHHRANLEDYKGSGYDRGHATTSSNYSNSQKNMDESFTLSAIFPQLGWNFNSGMWNKVEKAIQGMAMNFEKEESAHIITGALFLGKDDKGTKPSRVVQYHLIGKNDVAVPTHFFKVVLVEKGEDNFDEYAVLVPHINYSDDLSLSTFATSIEKIERLSGLHFFEKLCESDPPKIDKSRVRVLEESLWPLPHIKN